MEKRIFGKDERKIEGVVDSDSGDEENDEREIR